MNNADWLEASVRVPRDLAEQVESLMLAQGAMAVTQTGQGDTPWLEPAVGETPRWEAVLVTGLFPGDTPADRLASVLSLAPGVERPDRVILSSLPDRDWERAWLENFKPMQFGSGLWIVPTGYEPPDPEGLILRLDPGLAFGTGSHPTTRLCLEWLDATDVDGREVVDYGCGSGVLGIAAALKGARRVCCVDNDPQALTATQENAERNGVAGIVETMAPEAFSGRNADLLVANILAATLQELAPRLCTAVRPGGKIALSGVLAAQAGDVETAYAGCAHGFRTRELDGWILLSAIVGEARMGAE